MGLVSGEGTLRRRDKAGCFAQPLPPAHGPSTHSHSSLTLSKPRHSNWATAARTIPERRRFRPKPGGSRPDRTVSQIPGKEEGLGSNSGCTADQQGVLSLSASSPRAQLQPVSRWHRAFTWQSRYPGHAQFSSPVPPEGWRSPLS